MPSGGGDVKALDDGVRLQHVVGLWKTPVPRSSGRAPSPAPCHPVAAADLRGAHSSLFELESNSPPTYRRQSTQYDRPAAASKCTRLYVANGHWHTSGTWRGGGLHIWVGRVSSSRGKLSSQTTPSGGSSRSSHAAVA